MLYHSEEVIQLSAKDWLNRSAMSLNVLCWDSFKN